MLKKFLSALFIIALFFAAANSSIAQGTGTSPVEINPSLKEINGNTPFVEITFNGLDGDKNWHICSKSDCVKANDTIKDKGASVNNGSVTLMVCAANNDTLRVGKKDCDKNSGIDKGKDYFHEGKVYSLTLFEDEDQYVKGPTAAFYINHFYPNVRVTTTSDRLIQVEISGKRRLESKGDRNNYQISIEGTDIYDNKYKEDKCITVKDESASATFGAKGPDDKSPIGFGKYIVKINEQINEGIKGKLKTGGDVCNGGFTYWHVNADIVGASGGGAVVRDTVCPPPEAKSEGCTKDPNASDTEAFIKLLGEFSKIGELLLACDDYGYDKDGNFTCASVDTAIGSIPTNPIAFIERVFSIILSLGGIGALGVIIYGGYSYMISRGDPERIKAARETITSAIIGLLFIIFSLVILQVIAGDILRIPGFGGSSNPTKTGIDRVDDGTIPGTELPPFSP